MLIGHPLISPVVQSCFRLGESADGLIFPAIERWIPDALRHALAHVRRGDWTHDVFNAARMLRLELLQACRPHTSYRDTLRQVWHAWRYAGCVEDKIPSSAALAQARARCPVWPLEMLFKHLAALSTGCAPAWLQKRLLCVDGTFLTLPNTARLREHFGTTRHQHGEAYYPQALAVWVSLSGSNAVLVEHLGPVREGDESVAPRLLLTVLRAGDLVLGDGHYGGYATLHAIRHARAFFLARAPGPLCVDAHVTARFGGDDADLRLQLTPYVRRKYASLDLPECIDARTVAFNIPARDALNGMERAEFLTNLPREQFPVQQLAELVALRWNHETMNNDIKSRLGLGDVRGLTPHSVRLEVMAHLCMNNIVRMLFKQACPDTPQSCSFSAALSALRQANEQMRMMPENHAQITALMDAMIQDQPLSHRPNRSEPRMKRPQRRHYPIFKTPRAQWRDQRKVG